MMNSTAMGKPNILNREVAIIDYLRMRPEGATAREIYEEVSVAIDDNISRPAYYKLLDRLVATGKIEQFDNQGVRQYRISPQIHAANRLTLDDIYEMLPFVESTETMARVIEAQQYFIENRNTIIREAALALTKESATDLFFRWIKDLIIMLEADLANFQMVELADQELERRLETQCHTLRDMLYRQLSIPHTAVDLPDWKGPEGLQRNPQKLHYDLHELRQILASRVFGAGEQHTFLGLITVDSSTLLDAKEEMIISGSDGSFHAGTLGIRTAKGYIEDESFVITFNNSVAYVRSSDRVERQKGAKKFIHSAPLTRQTLDDPAYKGMALAPFMFPMLTDAEYEHMSKAAADVVQLRVDDEIFNGKARDIATGEQIMAPRVHIRDGTITLQDRGYNHYRRMDPYGDIVREGIERSRSILQRIIATRGTPRVFAGAVKSTQLRLFSRLLNWYIVKGSKEFLGEAIEPNWDLSRAGFISDIDAMTTLLASLEPRPQKDGFWTSCVVIRQFASLTDFFDVKLAGRTWFDLLRDKRKDALAAYDKYRGELPYDAQMSEEDLADDSYLYLLEYADYASFYVGHTGGEPAPKIPRYEFFCSLRDRKPEAANQFVQLTLEQLVTALLTCNFTPDRDHNFLSRLSIVKLIPYVVYQAHEFAKQLGKKLESEYKSIVVARLVARRNQPISGNDVEIQPIGVRQYLQRFSIARRALPPSQQDDENR